jgi:hypothetical protein
MIFVIMSNGLPIILGVLIYFSLSTGKIVSYSGAFGWITRSRHPRAYWTYMGLMIISEAIGVTFAIYVDLILLNAQMG